MKRKRKAYSRKALKLAPSPTPVPIQAEELMASPSASYVAPVETPDFQSPAQAAPWYRFGF